MADSQHSQELSDLGTGFGVGSSFRNQPRIVKVQFGIELNLALRVASGYSGNQAISPLATYSDETRSHDALARAAYWRAGLAQMKAGCRAHWKQHWDHLVELLRPRFRWFQTCEPHNRLKAP
jgi:hypothetical protein